MRKNQNTNATFVALISLVGLTTVSALVLTATKVSADDVVDDVTITVPISCSMSGTINSGNEHTAEIANGTYQAIIGTTSIKTLCNDNAGFSIYAIGNSGDTLGEEDSTKLLGTSASNNAKIVTGLATTAGNPDVSNWAMKLATDSQATYPLTIQSDTEGSFSSYHTVPAEYTKVATRLSGTDTGSNATGSTLTTTYAAYISKAQAADTYTGKVKYVLVHPNTATPSDVPVLTPTSTCTTQVPGAAYMQDINASNKATILAGMTEDAEYFLRDARDNKDYCVAKLKDGNLWMTQNLDHDIATNGSVTYDPTTTDIDSAWTPSSATTNILSWSSSETAPDSYDPGDLYWSGTPNDSTTTSTGNSHYHLGNYYNWTAAIAVNDSSSYGVYNDETGEYDNLEPDQSICPAGWMLPKGGTSNGSFQYLFEQYGWNSGTSQLADNNKAYNVPLYFALVHSLAESIGEVGRYWTSTSIGDFGDGYMGASDLAVYFDGEITPDDYYARSNGYSLRCLAR